MVIPSSVRIIGPNTFKNWASLKYIEFETGSKLTTIGNNAFSGAGLRSLQTPPSLKVIGKGAFTRCKCLREVTLNEGLTELQDHCFENSSVQSIAIPGSVQLIKFSAFLNCKELAKISFMEKSDLQSIGAKAFLGTPLTEVSVPRTKIALSAFDKSTNIDYIE